MKTRSPGSSPYHILGFRWALQDYFLGTRPQARRALRVLVWALLEDPGAWPLLGAEVRHYGRDKVSEILLKMAERMDLETEGIGPGDPQGRRLQANALTFYTRAGGLVRILAGESGTEPPSGDFRPRPSGGTRSREKVRKELVRIFRSNRCLLKATARALLTTPANLRLRVFPRYGIDADTIKREWLGDALERHGGRIPEAARYLGIRPQTLRRRARRYDLARGPGRRYPRTAWVDRSPLVPSYEAMYRATRETASPDRACRDFSLRFFAEVEQWFQGRFADAEEKRAVFRLLRLPAPRHLRRIERLYREVLGRKPEPGLERLSRYRLCHGLLREVRGRLADPKADCRTESLAPPDRLLLHLKVWALRHWADRPLNWKAYRARAAAPGESRGEETLQGTATARLAVTPCPRR